MVIVCGTVLLIAAAVVVALRERQSVPLPEAPVAQTPAEVRVKAVERNVETLDFSNAEAHLAMLAHSPLTSVRKIWYNTSAFSEEDDGLKNRAGGPSEMMLI